jgi:hypothetical protein
MSSVVIQGDTSGSVTIQAPTVSGSTVINLPTVTGGSFIVGDSGNNVSLSSNLTFTGTGNRIIGDFSNATIASRVAFQTNATNAATTLQVLPNGTSVQAGINLEGDPAATTGPVGQFTITSTDVRISSAIRGAGTYLPITFYNGGAERMRLDTNGNLGIGVTNPTAPLHIVTSGTTVVKFQGATTGLIGGLFSNATQVSLIESSGANLYQILPASNALALYTNSSERMRIDSSGRVLIGSVSTPGFSGVYPILQANTSSITNTDTDGATLALFGNSTYAQNAGAAIAFAYTYNTTSATATGARVRGAKENATLGDYAGYLAFDTRPAAGNFGERMRIDSAGNVGIGVTPSAWYSVNRALQLNSGASVSGSSSSVTQINVGANWYNNASGVDTFIGTGYATLYQQNTGLHKWFTSTASGVAAGAITVTQAMTLDTSGNLGIGTGANALAGKLEISAGTGAIAQRWSYTADPVNYNLRLYTVDNGASDVSWYFTHQTNGANTNVLSFKAGNVGIGTITPNTKLHVVGTLGNYSNSQTVPTPDNGSVPNTVFACNYSNGLAETNIWNTSATNTGGIRLSQVTGAGTYNDMAFFQKNLSVFYTGNVERMRIDPTGNVYIGATSATWNEKLGISLGSSTPNANVGLGIYHSAGSGYTGSMIRVQAETTGTGWKMYEGRGQGGGVLYWVDGTGAGYFSSNVLVGYTTTTSQAASSLLVAGNVGIGTNSPTAKLHIAAGGGGGYSTGNKLILQRNDATNPTGSIEFQGTGGHANPYWNILTDGDTTNDFGVAYNGGKVFQILTSGNVGIGTSSPTTKLEVSGSVSSSNYLLNVTAGTYGKVSDTSIEMRTSADATAQLMIFRVNGNNERMRIDSSGNVLVTNPAGLGYGTGAGGTVTQATNKGTAVTLNKPTGQITTNNAALGAGVTASFSVNNSLCTAADLVLLAVGNGSSYTVQLQFVSAGVFNLRLTNTTAGSLSEAVQINFAIIKGASA